MTVRRITSDQYALNRHVRLAALQDSPAAFCTTFAQASARTEDEWKQMAALRSEGNLSCLFLAFTDMEEAVGMVAGYRDDADTVQLTSLWVAPEARGTGMGRLLVRAVCDWAMSIPVKRVTLEVTRDNTGVLRFYECLGFVPLAEAPQELLPTTSQEIVFVQYL